jgi:prolyl oligopeptidase
MPLASTSISPVTDALHGVTVVDPYRWLEERNSSETTAWIGEQRSRHSAYFAQFGELDVLRDRVMSHLNREVIDQPTRLDSRLCFRRRKVDQEQGSICIRENNEERVLFDPFSMGIFASVAIQGISDDGGLLEIELKRDGSERKEVLLISGDTGAVLEDRLPSAYGRGFVFAQDSSDLYYCHEISKDPTDHLIHCHRFGRSNDKDEVVYRVPRTTGSALFVIGDGNRIGAVHIRESDGTPKADLSLCSMYDGPTAWKSVFTNRSGLYEPMLWNEKTFVLTEERAPNRHLIERAEDGDVVREVVPESSMLLQQLVLVGDRVYVQYLIDRKPMISAWSLDGEHLEDVPLAAEGTLTLLSDLNPRSGSLFLVHESFTEPPRIGEYTPADGVTNPFDSGCNREATTDIRVDEVVYPSSDGVEVPMSIVRKQGSDASQSAPLLLTGYGGFGVSMTPRFSVLVTVLLELGAVFALPGIRGGCEFGKRWHEAGHGRNRMTAINDFLVAAQWLIDEGITSSDRLGFFGGSNSGLLVVVAMIQRPDLFRAVLSIAPLLDMVRFERFGQARKWRSEYGSPDDPGDFKALLAYSPYHHVEESCDYPATLFVSGDSDDRCNPANVRKTAALLQNRDAQKNAIVVDYTDERGHSPVLPLSIRSNALARRAVFFCHGLGISVVKEASDESVCD